MNHKLLAVPKAHLQFGPRPRPERVWLEFDEFDAAPMAHQEAETWAEQGCLVRPKESLEGEPLLKTEGPTDHMCC